MAGFFDNMDYAPSGWGDSIADDFYSSSLSSDGWANGLFDSGNSYPVSLGDYGMGMGGAGFDIASLSQDAGNYGGISDYVSEMPYYAGDADGGGLMDMLSGFDKDYLQPAGRFLQSPGGGLLGGLGMGALSYLDRSSANKAQTKAQKKMLAQRQAVLDQMNARAAKYDAPIMGAVNTREEVEGPWGVGQDRYKNNSLAAITPGSSPSYLAGFAEGGVVYREPQIIGYDENRVPIYATEEESAPEPKKAAPQKPKSQSPLERLGAMFGVTSAIKKSQRDREFASGGYAHGGTPGQSDQIPAMLSDGEFVIDAATVADLGDGNNAAGASALERMRQNVRRHKRSAPANKIPPKAKKPEQYMKKGK